MKLLGFYRYFLLSFNKMKEHFLITRTMAQLAGRPGIATEIDNPPRSEYA